MILKCSILEDKTIFWLGLGITVVTYDLTETFPFLSKLAAYQNQNV